MQQKTNVVTPTAQIYGDLDYAFKFFNEELFGGKLPYPLFTLNRKRNALGYFWASRFEDRVKEKQKKDEDFLTDDDDGSDRVHEIALNPDYMKDRSDEDSASTIVHEMCHLQQQVFGTPPKRVYHNKEWAGMMKAVGLYPSTTGHEGGKETGRNCSHYIVRGEGDLFAKAFEKLLASGFTFSWQSFPIINIPKNSGKRVKYVCPECGAKAWAKAQDDGDEDEAPTTKLACAHVNPDYDEFDEDADESEMFKFFVMEPA